MNYKEGALVYGLSNFIIYDMEKFLDGKTLKVDKVAGRNPLKISCYIAEDHTAYDHAEINNKGKRSRLFFKRSIHPRSNRY